MNEKKIYCGIADAHGIESFQETSEMGKAPVYFTMRANLNRH